MGEIPEDVELSATLALDAILTSDSQYANVEIIARAILAERKRCAEVARHLNGWGPVGGNVVAEHIAKAIEAGQ